MKEATRSYPSRSVLDLSLLRLVFFHFPPSPLHVPYKRFISIRVLSSPGPVLNAPPPPHPVPRGANISLLHGNARANTCAHTHSEWLSLVKEGYELGEADSDTSFCSLLRDTSFSGNFLRRARNRHGKDIRS